MTRLVSGVCHHLGISRRLLFSMMLVCVVCRWLSNSASAQDRVDIESHANEAIIFDEKVTLVGRAISSLAVADGNLSVEVGGVPSIVPVVGGAWRVENVALGVGSTLIRVKYGSASQRIIITRA